MRFAAELKKKGREKLKRGEGGLVLRVLVVLGWTLPLTQFLHENGHIEYNIQVILKVHVQTTHTHTHTHTHTQGSVNSSATNTLHL